MPSVARPNNLPGVSPKPSYVLLMGTDKPKGRVQAANSATHIAMAP